jgi:hypothetical protein
MGLSWVYIAAQIEYYSIIESVVHILTWEHRKNCEIVATRAQNWVGHCFSHILAQPPPKVAVAQSGIAHHQNMEPPWINLRINLGATQKLATDNLGFSHGWEIHSGWSLPGVQMVV